MVLKRIKVFIIGTAIIEAKDGDGAEELADEQLREKLPPNYFVNVNPSKEWEEMK